MVSVDHKAIINARRAFGKVLEIWPELRELVPESDLGCIVLMTLRQTVDMYVVWRPRQWTLTLVSYNKHIYHHSRLTPGKGHPQHELMCLGPPVSHPKGVHLEGIQMHV